MQRPATVRLLLLCRRTARAEELGRSFSREPDIWMAGECSSMNQVFDMLAELPVDLILVDVDGEATGSEVATLSALRARPFRKRVVFVRDTTGKPDHAGSLEIATDNLQWRESSLPGLVDQVLQATKDALHTVR